MDRNTHGSCQLLASTTAFAWSQERKRAFTVPRKRPQPRRRDNHKAAAFDFKNSCSRNKLDWNETKWLSVASWRFCPSCGRRKADGKLEESWLSKKDVSRVAIPCKGGCDPRAALLCRPKDDAAVAPPRLPYVAPQQDDWPEELLGLTEVEAESLQIIRQFKVASLL